ncbi:MAG: thioredoxin family protein [Armatimonadetes bacterium]|nr:thioredoxin family protein [Armatimonadota bacterium]
MILIKIFGDPDEPECKRQMSIAKAVSERFPGQVEILAFSAESDEAMEYGIVRVPAVVADETILSVGNLVPAGRLKKYIGALLGVEG